MVLHDKPFFTETLLLEKLGPAPTISRVARFLDEHSSTTWRRLNEGQLKEVDGAGTARITLKSLAAMLNGDRDHEVTHKRGKRPGEKKPQAQKKKEAALK
jgi:hypothetical protein